MKEAFEAEKRGTALASTIDGKKTAILEKARETKSKGSDMLKTYIDEDSDALDGFEFLTMAEAGEVGHWKVLKTMAEKAGRPRSTELVQWGLPNQERHFSEAQQNCFVWRLKRTRTKQLTLSNKATLRRGGRLLPQRMRSIKRKKIAWPPQLC